MWNDLNGGVRPFRSDWPKELANTATLWSTVRRDGGRLTDLHALLVSKLPHSPKVFAMRSPGCRSGSKVEHVPSQHPYSLNTPKTAVSRSCRIDQVSDSETANESEWEWTRMNEQMFEDIKRQPINKFRGWQTNQSPLLNGYGHWALGRPFRCA